MALTRDQLWQAITRGNPGWLTGGADLTPAGVKKLFDTAFDAGHALGLENGRALAETGRPGASFADRLKNLFGHETRGE